MKTIHAAALLAMLLSLTLMPLRAQENTEGAEGAEAEERDLDEYIEFGEDAGIAVSATPETTQQMQVIEKGDIEKLHAPDLATLLEEALDIGITRYGAYGNQTEINIRGFDTERIAILIDGVPANSARSGEFDVSQIDLNSVERVEVIYGG
ncbi:MAG: Plug domain-containing protein, partial [Spirochaetaceae bacterium]|nr:Plug domain-containing protein [Spirochaetaceae bacterium]